MKRKYARIGEDISKYECTKRKCKWQGTDEEKHERQISEIESLHVCPKCGNHEFYGLLN